MGNLIGIALIMCVNLGTIGIFTIFCLLKKMDYVPLSSVLVISVFNILNFFIVDVSRFFG